MYSSQGRGLCVAQVTFLKNNLIIRCLTGSHRRNSTEFIFKVNTQCICFIVQQKHFTIPTDISHTTYITERKQRGHKGNQISLPFVTFKDDS